METKISPEAAAADRAAWETHAVVVGSAPPGAASGSRHAIGLALVMEQDDGTSFAAVGDRTLVPDRFVKWASIVDVPQGYMHPDRAAHWATVRPTTVVHGMPTLAAGAEGDNARDFRLVPRPRRRVDPAPGVVYTDARVAPLDPGVDPQLMRVFTAVEWAMTSAAAHQSNPWKPVRPAVYAARGFDYDPDAETYLFGAAAYDGIAQPHTWMPRAYLGFEEEAADRLFDATVFPVAGSRVAHTPEGMRAAFVDDLGRMLAYRAPFDGRLEAAKRGEYLGVPTVTLTLTRRRGPAERVRFFQPTCFLRRPLRSEFKAGDVLAEDRPRGGALPEEWYSMSVYGRWIKALALFGDAFNHVLRAWYSRQAVRVRPGLVHYPSCLTSVPASWAAVDGELMWDVGPGLEYFRDDCDAMVFPTIALRAWDDLSGVLPGDVAYDLTPTDPRFVPGRHRPGRTPPRGGGAA